MNATWIGKMATRAMLYEVSTSPKPGLVDRFNAGAHDDMDYYMFIASASSLTMGFQTLASMGKESYLDPIDSLLTKVRPVGIEMEKDMFRATGGINTHKGMIFSLGLVTFMAARLGSHLKNKRVDIEAILDGVAEMTKGISERELNKESKLSTHGERVFRNYGKHGIRGEIENGFPTLRCGVLDEIRTGCYDYVNLDHYFIQLLFMLMKQCDDTTILHRHDPSTLKGVQLKAASFLNKGGMRQSDAMEQVKDLDRLFIKQGISPGGSADLLAVSIMLGLLEGTIN